MEPVPRADALAWLRSQYPAESQETLQAAYYRSGGYLGQARTLLQGDLQLPQTVQFSQVYAAGDAYGLTLLLCSMEKLPRDKLLAVLTQWKQLLADALQVRAGLPGSPEAANLGRRRTAAALAAAANTLQTAMDDCNANIGAGHICGWLAVTL